ncbi:MAG: translocation/assembly module TamB domain-containing protein [Elusimicrobiota bacterium]
MKKIILILFILTILVVSAYSLAWLNIFTISLKHFVQSQLTIAISKPVKVEKLFLLSFNKIMLKNVQFEGLKCEKAIISIDIRKISKGFSSIENITLINPQVNIHELKYLFKKKSGKYATIALPAKVFAINGTVIYNSTFSINNIDFKAVSKNDNYAVKLEAVMSVKEKNNFSSHIKIAGMINKDTSVKLKGSIENATFNNLEKIKGSFNVKGYVDNFNLSSDIKSEEVNLNINSNIICENLFKINSQISGDVSNLKIVAEKLFPNSNQNTIIQYLPKEPLSFNASFELPDKKLIVNLHQNNFKLINNIPLENMETNLVIFNDECVVNSTITAFSGTANLTGKIWKNNLLDQSNGQQVSDCQASLDLSLVTKDILIKSDCVSSTISLDAKITGSFDNPKIAGDVKTNNFTLKGKLPKNISGKILWENDAGSVKTVGPDFALNIEGNKSEITSGVIKYDVTKILFSGKYTKINLKASNVDISMLTSLGGKHLIKLEKNVSGFIKHIDGYLKNGFSKNPEIAISFSSNLSDGQAGNIIINASTVSVSGNFFYDTCGIYVKNLKMNGLKGEVKIKEKETSGNLNFSRCNSNLILPFVGVEQDIISGYITGNIKWDGEIKNPKPCGTLSITDGKLFKNIAYSSIIFSFKTDISKIIITEIAIQQEASKTALRLSGEVDKDGFDFNLNLDEFIISNQPDRFTVDKVGLLPMKPQVNQVDSSITKKTIAGDIKIYGRKTIDNFVKFKIASTNLTIDKITEKLSAYGIYDGEKIIIKKILWGDMVSGTASYLISSKYLSSDIDFKIESRNFNENLRGPFVGKIIILGDINNPQVFVTYRFDGEIYEKMANGYGKILINNSLLKVEKTKLTVDGAEVEISGVVDLRKKEFSGLNVLLCNLKTQTIYDLFSRCFAKTKHLTTIPIYQNCGGDDKEKECPPVSFVSAEDESTQINKTKSTSEYSLITEQVGALIPRISIQGSSITHTVSHAVPGIFQKVELNIFGEIKNPQIMVEFSGEKIALENKIVDSIEGKCFIKDKKIIFSKGDIKWSSTNIRILQDTYIDFKKKIVFKIISEIRNLKFPQITLFGNITADGMVDECLVKADISTTGLWVNQKQLRDLKYHIEYKNGIIQFIPETNKTTQITGTVDFSKLPDFFISNFSITEKSKRLFYLNGMLKNDNLDIVSEGENIILGDLLNLLGVKITAQGNTNFSLKATGNLKEPVITCTLNSNNGKIENLDFDLASVFFHLKENILELKGIKISKEKLYLLEGEGITPLPLNPDSRKKLLNYPINISLKVINGDLAILPSLTKSIKKAKGNFSTNINVKGTINKPDVKGTLVVKASEIQLCSIFKKLTDVKCEVDFLGEKILIKNLCALVGKEPLTLTGEAMFADDFNLTNFNFHLLTLGKSIPITINELQIKSSGVGKIIPIVSDITVLPNPSKAKVAVDIKFFGTQDSWSIDGYMKLSDARFTYPGEEDGDGDVDYGILKNATWNLRIIGGENCWYEKDFASVEAKGEILLHGKGSSPLVTGKVEALRGELDYLGRNFTVKEAIFDADKSDLYLSGMAECETEIERRREDLATRQMITEYIPETIILMIDRGPLDNVKPRFLSKTTPQTEEQLLIQAAMGLADTKQKQLFSAQEISKAVDTLLTTPFVKSLLKRTGFIDKFVIKRWASSTSLPSQVKQSVVDLYKGTKLQFGKSFTQGFSAGYGIKFDEFENKLSLKHELELSYRMKNGIILRTTQELGKDEFGERANKFFLEKYWRFGTGNEKKQN